MLNSADIALADSVFAARNANRESRIAVPLIRNFLYSDRFIRPSSHTTIDATVSAP
jgi:hypothetical protein